MTVDGYTALEEELKKLVTEDRVAVIGDISEARDHGDLSENAEYHAARERQSFIEGRIMEIEGYLARADVVRPEDVQGDTIKFAATVGLLDDDSGEEVSYKIVGEPEADISQGRLNINSPLARALIGKRVGDPVEVSTPRGDKSYEIVSICYK